MSKFIAFLCILCIIISLTEAKDSGKLEKAQSLDTECGNLCVLKCRKKEFEPCFRQCYRDCEYPKGIVSHDDKHLTEPSNSTVQTYISIYKEYYEAGTLCNDYNLQLYISVNETFCPTYCKDTEFQPCYKNGYAGCACKPGTARRDDGECVEPRYCTVFSATTDEAEFGVTPGRCQEPNEQWYDGSSTFCPHYCGEATFQPCYKGGNAGCSCKPGTYLRDDGKCVEIQDCITDNFPKPNASRICNKPNQEWSECGTACPRKCGEREPKLCTMQCIVGCHCKPGTVLRDDGKCVEPKDCTEEIESKRKVFQMFSPMLHDIIPEKCDMPNQRWNDCGTACPPKCGESEFQICTRECAIGCECIPGTILSEDGNCIDPKDCPEEIEPMDDS